MQSTRKPGSLTQALATALVFAGPAQTPPRPRGPRPAEGYPLAARPQAPDIVQHNLLVDMTKAAKRARKAQR